MLNGLCFWPTYEKNMAAQKSKAASVLDGISRDGRRPSQLLSHIDERLDDVSIDDIKKEMLLRQMPREVRHALSQQVKTKTATELAEMADSYFDQEGKPLHVSNATVSSLSSRFEKVTIEDLPEDNDTEVNAAFSFQRGRSTFQQGSQQSRQQQSSSKFRSGRSKSRAPDIVDGLCWPHRKFQDKAYRCSPGCTKYATFQAGNAQAGKRK